MLSSMTGFGRGEASSNGFTITTEIKTLNSRYLDLSIRLPQPLQEKEFALKELLQTTISRGKVNVTIHLSRKEEAENPIHLNHEKVTNYLNVLHQLRSKINSPGLITLNELLPFLPEFIKIEEKNDEETQQQLWDLCSNSVQQAIGMLQKMRAQEGSQLKVDMLDRIAIIQEHMKNVIKISGSRSGEIREKMLERIKKIMEDKSFDPERLEQEIAILIDKLDITEEVVRLEAHLKFFIEAMEHGHQMGRRLNFLTQEINRELNTIGSKSNHADIAKCVVIAKECLEQIREQVQNIE